MGSGLRVARQQAGMSQAAFARMLEVDSSIVRHVESGRMKPYPRFRRVAAEILGVTEQQLFDVDDNQKE